MVKFCGSNIGGLYINLDAVPIVIVCSKKFFPVWIQARGSSKNAGPDSCGDRIRLIYLLLPHRQFIIPNGIRVLITVHPS